MNALEIAPPHAPFKAAENLLVSLLSAFPGSVSPAYLNMIEVGEEVPLLSPADVANAHKLLGTIRFMIEGGLLEANVIDSGGTRLYDALRLTPEAFSRLSKANGALSLVVYDLLAKRSLEAGMKSL